MKILIVAHPDDEMLWFNPFVFDLIVIVFCNRNDQRDKKKDMGRARKEAVNKLPYANKTVMLNLTEPGTWRNRERVAEYANAKIALIDKLAALKNTYHFSSLFTHNSAGEYGHLDHILIHQCVLETFSNICPIWAPNIFIKKQNAIKHTGPKYTEKNSLLKFLSLRRIYMQHKAWTWNLMYLPKFRQTYHLVNHVQA